MAKKLLSVRLPEKVISKLKNVCALEDVSQAFLIEKLITLYVSQKFNVSNEPYTKKELAIQKEVE